MLRMFLPLLVLPALSFASDLRTTCEITGKNGWHNRGLIYTHEMRLDECVAEAKTLLELPMEDNQRIFNPFRRTAVDTYFRVTFKQVKMRYRSIDGTLSQVFRNPDASVEVIDRKEIELGSRFFKCWFSQECD